jgi:hypothetical protein
MMLWVTWVELYSKAVHDLWFGQQEPAARPSATIISLAAERARRRCAAVRAP